MIKSARWLWLKKIEYQGFKVKLKIIYQDNESAIKLEKNCKESSGKHTYQFNIKYYYVTDDEANDRSDFLRFLIENNDWIKNSLNGSIKIYDLAFGSGNLTAHIILDNGLTPEEIYLNDKFLSDSNSQLKGNLEAYFSNLSAYTSSLDFFEPELDFIDYDLKKQVILDIAKKTDLITVCTSPYFINQERALEVLRDIFDS